MTSSPSIMLIGLPPGNKSAVLEGAKQPPAEMMAMIKAQLEALPEQMRAVGVDFRFFDVAPDEADGLTRLRDALKEKPYDGVVIGNGVRSNIPLTEWMEKIIDVVREGAPNAKLMFNTFPATTIDAVRRWFPIPSSTA